jgi:hypothetical protein
MHPGPGGVLGRQHPDRALDHVPEGVGDERVGALLVEPPRQQFSVARHRADGGRLRATIRSSQVTDDVITIVLGGVRAVETHRAHIQQKLGRSSRAQLVRYALDNDLIER